MTHTNETHPLDNPIWHALNTTHAHVAQGGLLARRYPIEIAPFGACGAYTPAAFREFAQSIQPEGMVATFTATPLTLPDEWEVIHTQVITQMICERLEWEPDHAHVILNADDVPDMLALVEHTKPGPFKRGTIQMGQYVGVRASGGLIAMAGERLHLAGYTEVSAVCTHPDYQGQGYGKALVAAVCQDIFARGEAPFLHVKTNNARAVHVYQRLGFTERTNIHMAVLRCTQ